MRYAEDNKYTKVIGKKEFTSEHIRKYGTHVALFIPSEDAGGQVQPIGATQTALAASGKRAGPHRAAPGGLPRLGPSRSHRRSSPVTDPYGIIDLAALKQPAGGESGGAGSAGTPSAHEVAVTEQGLEQLIADSQSIPTLLLVTSARVPEADQFLSGLRRGVDAQGGAVRLGIVDADTQQRVAGALRVQQLPTLLLLIQGQLQPIVQSVIPDAEIDNLLTQVVEVARQQGMELPEGEAASQEPQEEPLPPLIAEAHEAIERGDLDAAVASDEKHLQESPADAEAKAGLGAVCLRRRTQDADLAAAREAAAQHPDDLDAQLLVADLDMLGGHVDDAFARLLEQLRGADQETKDAVRARLLELFEVAGPSDPRVAPARKRLANLLF